MGLEQKVRSTKIDEGEGFFARELTGKALKFQTEPSLFGPCFRYFLIGIVHGGHKF